MEEREGYAEDPMLDALVADKFRIVSYIAQGGMGSVYRAVQEPLGRAVALKTTRADRDIQGVKERFILEASVLSKLKHSNTVRVFDFGSMDDGTLYLVMEFVEGVTVQDALRDVGSLPPERAIHIALQLCGALGEAHKQGVLHRDVKPANVLLTNEGEDTDFVKLVDFGLVKDEQGEGITEANVKMGSPDYMAPEQIEGKSPVTARSDVYALGCVLFAMLTGEPPFPRNSLTATLMAHLTQDPPPFDEVFSDHQASPNLEWVVRTAMAKSPGERFRSMDDMAAALRVCAVELEEPEGPRRQLTLDSAGGLLVDGEMPDGTLFRQRRSGGFRRHATGATLIGEEGDSNTWEEPMVVSSKGVGGARLLAAGGLGLGTLAVVALLAVGALGIGGFALWQLRSAPPAGVVALSDDEPAHREELAAMRARLDTVSERIGEACEAKGEVTAMLLVKPDGQVGKARVRGTDLDEKRALCVQTALERLTLPRLSPSAVRVELAIEL